MANNRGIPELFTSPAAFRDLLIIDADGGPRPFRDCIDPWQRADFESLDPAWKYVAGRGPEPAIKRAWLERPRGHSKTLDNAVSACFALVASERQLRGVCAASDVDQAGFLRDAVERLVRLNPWMDKLLEVQKWKVVNRHTGSDLQIISSDVGSSYGLSLDFCICDEVTHWAKPDMWDSLASAVAKRRNCLMLCIANAGFMESWQWPLREEIRTDPRWHFNHLEGPQASWITADRLDEQRRLLRTEAAFARLWLNRWSSGSGDFPADLVDAAIAPNSGPTLTREPGWLVFAGMDWSWKRDSTCLAIVARHVGYAEALPQAKPPPPAGINEHLLDLGIIEESVNLPELAQYRYVEGTGRLKLVALKIWLPGGSRKEIDFAQVEADVAAAHKLYGFAWCACESPMAQASIQRLQAQGVPIDAVAPSAPNQRAICDAVLAAFHERSIDLFNQPELIADLKALRVVENAQGVRLKPGESTAGTPHGDAAIAFGHALFAAQKAAQFQPATINRPLLCAVI